MQNNSKAQLQTQVMSRQVGVHSRNTLVHRFVETNHLGGIQFTRHGF
jgi:hypothetical protein